MSMLSINIVRTVSLLFILLAAGCVKDPGIGGRAEIQGRVMEQRYNSSGVPQGDPYPRAGRRVYISYGAEEGQDDTERTGPEGHFRFPWLRKGTYRIHVMSQCQVDPVDCPAGTREVWRIVELSDRKAVVDVGDLLIENW
jgi:hypothetical protein